MAIVLRVGFRPLGPPNASTIFRWVCTHRIHGVQRRVYSPRAPGIEHSRRIALAFGWALRADGGSGAPLLVCPCHVHPAGEREGGADNERNYN